MKTTLLILLFVCTLLNAQQSVLMLGELKIFGLNIPQEVELTFETEKVPSTSHWDFQNNLVLNSYYTYQNFTLSYSNTYDSFWFRTGETTGMGKGLYKVTAKNSNDSLLAYFYYDLRTCIDYNNTPDLEVTFNYTNSLFRFNNSTPPWNNMSINDELVESWIYTAHMCCEQETDLFEPQAPTNLFVYSSGGIHPQLYWNNNDQQDFWTNVDVYRSLVYSGGPDGFDQIATLGRNATSYYDSEYFTGQVPIAYYQIRKRNVYKNSVPSNTVSINIIPAKMTEESNQIQVSTEREDFRDYLFQNYPNPFNPTTEIKFEITDSGNISLDVYDILGRKIYTLANGFYTKGLYKFNFNASVIPSGIYYCIFKTNYTVQTRKMLLLK